MNNSQTLPHNNNNNNNNICNVVRKKQLYLFDYKKKIAEVTDPPV